MQHYKIVELHANLSVDVVRKERTIAVRRYPLRTAISRVAVYCFWFLLCWILRSLVVFVFWAWGCGGFSYKGGQHLLLNCFLSYTGNHPLSPRSIYLCEVCYTQTSL